MDGGSRDAPGGELGLLHPHRSEDGGWIWDSAHAVEKRDTSAELSSGIWDVKPREEGGMTLRLSA